MLCSVFMGFVVYPGNWWHFVISQGAEMDFSVCIHELGLAFEVILVTPYTIPSSGMFFNRDFVTENLFISLLKSPSKVNSCIGSS